MAKKALAPDFETNLQELEKLVKNLEKGELSLEESLEQFERGIELTKSCEKKLSEAKQKVEVLLGDDATQRLGPFPTDNDDPA